MLFPARNFLQRWIALFKLHHHQSGEKSTETGSIRGALIFQPESQRESVEGMKILSAGALEGQRLAEIKHNLNTEEEHKGKYPPFNAYFEEMPTIICATDSNIFIAIVNNMLVVHCIQDLKDPYDAEFTLMCHSELPRN